MDIPDDKLGVTACPWCDGELFAGRHTQSGADCPGPPKPGKSQWPNDKGVAK